jgi:hypothetical protein
LEKYKNELAKLVLIAPATETDTAIRLFSKIVGLKEQVRLAINELVLERSGKSIDFYSIKRIIPLLSNQILWVHDKNDKITPLTDVDPLMESSPSHVEFYITEGLGHSRIYKDPVVIEKVIEFLNV